MNDEARTRRVKIFEDEAVAILDQLSELADGDSSKSIRSSLRDQRRVENSEQALREIDPDGADPGLYRR